MSMEGSMRRALGLAPKAKPSTITPGLSVTQSVRPKDGGTVRSFRFRSSTISRLLAQIEAEQAARAMNLIPWALISIGDDE